MVDWVKLGELGAVVVALLCVLGLIAVVIEIVRKRYRESGSGDRRNSPIVVGCPNHIEGMHATLVALVNECKEQTGLNNREIEFLTHNKQCLDNLISSHSPRSGREWWKTTEKAEQIQEDIRDDIRDVKTGIGELVLIARKNGK